LSRSAAHRPTWISTVEILTLVAAGRGIAIVPAAVATQQPRPHIVYVPVTDAHPAVVSLARRPGSTNRPSNCSFTRPEKWLRAENPKERPSRAWPIAD
jgi:DNA-binding transcriptional LysR family regulator